MRRLHNYLNTVRVRIPALLLTADKNTMQQASSRSRDARSCSHSDCCMQCKPAGQQQWCASLADGAAALARCALQHKLVSIILSRTTWSLLLTGSVPKACALLDSARFGSCGCAQPLHLKFQGHVYKPCLPVWSHVSCCTRWQHGHHTPCTSSRSCRVPVV